MNSRSPLYESLITDLFITRLQVEFFFFFFLSKKNQSPAQKCDIILCSVIIVSK